LFCDVGATYFLPRLFNNKAELGLYTGLTGERIKGVDLAKCGVATHFVPSERIQEMKDELITCGEEMVSKEKISKVIEKYSEHVYSPETFYFANEEEIVKIFKLDSLTEIYGRLVELASKDENSWASKAIKQINSGSPISLCVVLEQLKRGIRMKTLEDALDLESQMVASYFIY